MELLGVGLKCTVLSCFLQSPPECQITSGDVVARKGKIKVGACNAYSLSELRFVLVSDGKRICGTLQLQCSTGEKIVVIKGMLSNNFFSSPLESLGPKWHEWCAKRYLVIS